MLSEGDARGARPDEFVIESTAGSLRKLGLHLFHGAEAGTNILADCVCVCKGGRASAPNQAIRRSCAYAACQGIPVIESKLGARFGRAGFALIVTAAPDRSRRLGRGPALLGCSVAPKPCKFAGLPSFRACRAGPDVAPVVTTASPPCRACFKLLKGTQTGDCCLADSVCLQEEGSADAALVGPSGAGTVPWGVTVPV